MTMFHGLLSVLLTLALPATSQSLVNGATDAQQVCLLGHVQVIISTLVTRYPVVIDQYYNHNTVIDIEGGLQININNAPTYYITTALVTVTQNITTTITVTPTAIGLPNTTSSSTTSPTFIPTSGSPSLFVFQVFPAQGTGFMKRQQGTPFYVSQDGALVADLTEAAQFFINAFGQILSSEGAILSIAQTTGFNAFALSTVLAEGAISTTVDLSSGFLAWTNAAFELGRVLFYEFEAALIALVGGHPPQGATPVQVGTMAVSALSISSSTSTSMEPFPKTSPSSSISSLSPDTSTASISTTEIPTQTATNKISGATLAPDSSFVIAVNDGSATKHKRAIKYLAFTNGASTITENIEDGARLTASDGSLFSAGNNVGLTNADLAAGFAPLRLFPGKPDVSKTFTAAQGGTFDFTPSADNGQPLALTATYCSAQNGSIYMHYSAADMPFSCTPLVVNILFVANNVTATSVSSTSSSSTTDISESLSDITSSVDSILPTSASAISTSTATSPSKASTDYSTSAATDSNPPSTTSASCTEPITLINGDFETGNQEPWFEADAQGSISVISTGCHSGTFCMLMSSTVYQNDMIQVFTTAVGKSYEFTAYARPTSESMLTCTVEYQINTNNTPSGFMTIATGGPYTDTTTWVLSTGTFTAPTVNPVLYIIAKCIAPYQTLDSIVFDDISLIASDSTCRDPVTAIPSTASSDFPASATTESTSFSTTSASCTEPTTLVNGNFETGNQEPWHEALAEGSLSIISTGCHSGTFCISMSSTVYQNVMVQPFTAVMGETYEFTAYSRPTSESMLTCTVEYQINVDNTASGFVTIATGGPFADTTTWFQSMGTFTAPAVNQVIYIIAHCVSPYQTLDSIVFDDISLVASDSTCGGPTENSATATIPSITSSDFPKSATTESSPSSITSASCIEPTTLVNGNFETGNQEPWHEALAEGSLSIISTGCHSGTFCMLMSSTVYQNVMVQPFKAVVGETYEFTAYSRPTSEPMLTCTVEYQINIDNTPSGFVTIATGGPYTDTILWVQSMGTFTAQAVNQVIYIIAHCVSPYQTLDSIVFDDISLVASDSTCAGPTENSATATIPSIISSDFPTSATTESTTSSITSASCIEPTTLVNGNFETGNQEPWHEALAEGSLSIISTGCHSGAFCMLMSSTVYQNVMVQPFKAVVGEVYEFTAYSRPTSESMLTCTVEYQINVDNTASGFVTIATGGPYTDTILWVQSTGTFTAPAVNQVIYIIAKCIAPYQTLDSIIFDDISLIASTSICGDTTARSASETISSTISTTSTPDSTSSTTTSSTVLAIPDCTVGAQAIFNPGFDLSAHGEPPLGWIADADSTVTAYNGYMNNPFYVSKPNSLEFNGYQYPTANFSLSQILTTLCAGSPYTFSAYVYVQGIQATCHLEASLDGTIFATMNIVPADTSGGPRPYYLFPGFVNATAATQTLLLRPVCDSGMDNLLDMAFDNVTLTLGGSLGPTVIQGCPDVC
ncbi:hypothetical protein BP6252_08889 [Coleophoma cylindrospora]|uniref:CBM-cenC domain-containing protein n=1 Tax=Coleophoma cylindrospora TaxID=1849047 RepID=A0A3D8R744_9HELO|nr:hypothetical protein BP6252_08889 [Coleophoma cylindrospora]